ncbi:MAG: exonuclease domain-containing protein [Motilibacteraceae bacterium]
MKAHEDLNLFALTHGIRFVVVDVETTDSDTGRHVLAWAVRHWRMDPDPAHPVPAPQARFVDPGVPIENSRLHHITAQTLAEHAAAPFADHIGELEQALSAGAGEQVVLVAQNARFDVSSLHLEFGRAGRSLPQDLPVLDTIALARWVRLPVPNHRLGTLLEHYGLALTRHHDAASDAADTTRLLRALLRTAAAQGVTDLRAPHPETGALLPLPRVGDHRAALAMRDPGKAGYLFVDRSREHESTHRAGRGKGALRSAAARQAWLAGAVECVQLRCPGLQAKTEAVREPGARQLFVDELLERCQAHHEAGENTRANTALGAALNLLPHVVGTDTASAWLDTWAPRLAQVVRCPDPRPYDPERSPHAPPDACAPCRAGRGCPADTWQSTAAMLLLGSRQKRNAAGDPAWLAPGGRLDQLIDAGHVELAGNIVWLLYEMSSTSAPRRAREVATSSVAARVTHPKLTRVLALTAERDGDRDQARALLEQTLAARNGSSDTAWDDLRDLRDAVAARQVAAQRAAEAAARRANTPARKGHTSPQDRPVRLRFSLAQFRPPASAPTSARPGQCVLGSASAAADQAGPPGPGPRGSRTPPSPSSVPKPPTRRAARSRLDRPSQS